MRSGLWIEAIAEISEGGCKLCLISVANVHMYPRAEYVVIDTRGVVGGRDGSSTLGQPSAHGIRKEQRDEGQEH